MRSDRSKGPRPDRQRSRFPNSPAKVPGDRDEAKALPDDIAVNTRGGPDADAHAPAMASSVADEEAGGGESGGRIEPLQSKGSPQKPGGAER